MLASIVLLLCVAASVAAAGIVFVLFGPIPTNRKVTLVPRIQAPLPVAASPIAMPGMPVFDPARAAFTPVAPEPIAYPAPTPRVRPLPPIAPVQLRRPRTGPSPLSRTRSARGTEPRPQAFDVEHTAMDAPIFEVDDPTFLEDGQ